MKNCFCVLILLFISLTVLGQSPSIGWIDGHLINIPVTPNYGTGTGAGTFFPTYSPGNFYNSSGSSSHSNSTYQSPSYSSSNNSDTWAPYHSTTYSSESSQQKRDAQEYNSYLNSVSSSSSGTAEDPRANYVASDYQIMADKYGRVALYYLIKSAEFRWQSNVKTYYSNNSKIFQKDNEDKQKEAKIAIQKVIHSLDSAQKKADFKVAAFNDGILFTQDGFLANEVIKDIENISLKYNIEEWFKASEIIPDKSVQEILNLRISCNSGSKIDRIMLQGASTLAISAQLALKDGNRSISNVP